MSQARREARKRLTAAKAFMLNEWQRKRLSGTALPVAPMLPLAIIGSHAMHDRDPFEQFRPLAREPKAGTFHRPAHGFGMKRIPEAAELRLSGPTTAEQKLGEGLRELPLVGQAPPTHPRKPKPRSNTVLP
jgi:hypothetical protein